MNKRIRQVRELLKLSQDEFAEKLQLQRNSISRIETGSRNASNRTINDICDTFNVNELWLRNGEGDIFKPHTETNKNLKELIRLFDDLTPELQDFIVLQAKNLLNTQEKLQNQIKEGK